MARLRALLVGIDAYPPPVPALAGCVNDITEMETTLRGRVPPDALDLRVLTDAAATRPAVVDAIAHHLGSAGPDDVALFCFSGHGSQQQAPPEAWSLEPDHRNETIVLVDSRTPGSWDLTDKELATLLHPVADRAGHVLVVLDCCHSGDGTRDLSLQTRVRLAPADPRPRPWDTFVTGARSASSGPGGVRGHVLLAACRSSETAKETTVEGRARGALSAVLGRALRECEGQPTYRDIHRLVAAGVAGLVADQHPQLETADATDLDRVFLGGTVTPRPRQLTLAHTADGWSIDAGAVHGVPQLIGDDSTELAVYPQDGATDAVPLATATVTRVLPDRSLVTVSPDLDRTAFYRAVITSIPLPPLRIGLVGDCAGIPTDTADATLVTFVDDPAGADVLVRADRDGFTVLRPGVARPVVELTGPDRERRIVTALERVARWLRLSALHNPATQLPSGAIEVGLATTAGSVGPDGRLEIAYVARLAPAFTVTLRNTSPVTLWCALVDLTEAYGIFTDALPAGAVGLGPGESVDVALTGQVSDDSWRAGTTTVTDHLKVIVSTLEFDPRSLQQPELDVAEDGVPVRSVTEPRSTLDRLLTAVTTRRAQPAGPRQPVADWRTADVFVTTSRPR
ncbi:caspase family protein [Intrasporangium sp.]|uniref:caspase family protein n=1 Tax=Intrasporangium sp. TaxID=1925024 RepID=UPI003221A7B5